MPLLFAMFSFANCVPFHTTIFCLDYCDNGLVYSILEIEHKVISVNSQF